MADSPVNLNQQKYTIFLSICSSLHCTALAGFLATSDGSLSTYPIKDAPNTWAAVRVAHGARRHAKRKDIEKRENKMYERNPIKMYESCAEC